MGQKISHCNGWHIGGTGLTKKAEGAPAFGMKTFKSRYNLLERYHIAPPDIENLKTRLLANENPWGPSKKSCSRYCCCSNKRKPLCLQQCIQNGRDTCRKGKCLTWKHLNCSGVQLMCWKRSRLRYEAYIELLEKPETQSVVGLIKEGYDVIISRTFSKVHGTAGLRIGYMVASAERVKMIQNIVRTEMGISVTSLEGALASLKDIEFQEYTRENNIKHRNYVFAELEKAGMNPIPSYTSFVLFPIQIPVKDMMAKMFEKGVGIGGYEIQEKPYGRVSIGTMDELKLFVKTLQGIVS